jgi:hypothetical protein
MEGGGESTADGCSGEGGRPIDAARPDRCFAFRLDRITAAFEIRDRVYHSFDLRQACSAPQSFSENGLQSLSRCPPSEVLCHLRHES